MGRLYDMSQATYQRMVDIVAEKTGHRLAPDPHDAQNAGDGALCRGKVTQGMKLRELCAHCNDKCRGQRAKVAAGGSDDDDEDEGELEAAREWAHAELLKYIRGTASLEAAAKRQRLAALEPTVEICKPPMLHLVGLPCERYGKPPGFDTSPACLASQAKLKEKFPEATSYFPAYAPEFTGEVIIVFASSDDHEAAFGHALKWVDEIKAAASAAAAASDASAPGEPSSSSSSGAPKIDEELGPNAQVEFVSQALLGELHSKAERFKGHWTQKMWKKVRPYLPAGLLRGRPLLSRL